MSEYTYQIRCMHIDYERQSDEEGEFHWRCRSLFAFDAELAPWQRDFCPYHRLPYRPTDHVLSRDEVQALNRKLLRTYHEMTMPEATRDGDGLSDEERAWAAERKRELLDQAIGAGVLARDPGVEG